jgi:hypothetical protein
MPTAFKTTQTADLHDSGLAFRPENLAKFRAAKAHLQQGACWVMPTRGSMRIEAVLSLLGLQWPMNQDRTPLLTANGFEVGSAYQSLFELAIDRDVAVGTVGPDFAERIQKMPFILTSEEDNLPAPDGIIKLMQAIYTCVDCGKEIEPHGWECPDGHRGLDAVSGLYWTKDIPAMPMAYGNPKDTELRFEPQDITAAIDAKATVEVNGIAMGFTLYRKELFSRVSRPWFQTEAGVTQDLWFCKKAKEEAGARFAVACGVTVGHITMDGRLF